MPALEGDDALQRLSLSFPTVSANPISRRDHESPTKMPRLKIIISLSLLSTLLFLLLGLSACGANESVTHIKGSSATITKPMLNHWMRALVGGDFRANVGTKGPVGLVSEPANYPECEAAAKRIVPRSFTGQLTLNELQISRKCHQLYRAIKTQALELLLSIQWTVREGEEQGLHISDAELHRHFQRYAKEVYGSPVEANERKYLAERHWVEDDVLYMLKRNMLVSRILPKFKAKVDKAGGGEKTYARLVLERYHALVAKTTCMPGYVVQGCREYREPGVPLPSASVILEALAKRHRG